MTEARDTLSILQNHGFPLSEMAPEELAVLAGLSDTELDLLLTIKAQLDEAAPEVVAHSEMAGAALF
jgi:hypothetical protein